MERRQITDRDGVGSGDVDFTRSYGGCHGNKRLRRRVMGQAQRQATDRADEQYGYQRNRYNALPEFAALPERSPLIPGLIPEAARQRL